MSYSLGPTNSLALSRRPDDFDRHVSPEWAWGICGKMTCLFLIVLNGLLFLDYAESVAQESGGDSPRAIKLPDSTLLYVSDYFSFVGEDDQGHVAFAMDTNRGQDGDSYQAEHFVVFHNENQGWLPMEGNGPYPNEKNELLTIPDSQAFQFQGTPQTGWTIISQPNQLTLTIKPIPERISKTEKGGHFWMGSAPATLEWKDRNLQGRVIYEFLLMPEFNRLTRTYWALWNEFQGFYLSVQGLGDLYIHSQESELIAPLIGNVNGFLAVHEETDPFKVLQLTTVDLKQEFGFYKWPRKWMANWASKKGPGKIQFEMSEFNRIANWVIGGFSMGIIRGKVTYQGQTYEAYGIVELIM